MSLSLFVNHILIAVTYARERIQSSIYFQLIKEFELKMNKSAPVPGPDDRDPFPLVKSLDACNDIRVRKYPKSDLEKGWIISKEYKFYIPPTCQTFVNIGSHCNCGSTTTAWQFSIEKGNHKTLYYLYLLHIQRPSLAFPKAVFLL